MMGNGNRKAPNDPPDNQNRPMTRAYRRALERQALEQAAAPQQQENVESGTSRKRSNEQTQKGDGDGPKSKERRYERLIPDENVEEDMIIDDDSDTETQSAINQRKLRENPSTTRTIVAEQNNAYKESLLADQEKDRVKKEKAKKEQEEKQKLIDEEKNTIQSKKEAKENLPPESSENEEGVFPVILRLPSGGRIRRNFRATDSVHTLFQFAFSAEETPMVFEIVMYPNRIIPQGENEDGSTVTLKDIGITNKQILHVRKPAEDE